MKSTLSSKITFAIVLISIIIGILIGTYLQTMLMSAIFFTFAILIYFFVKAKIKSPISAYRYRHLHILWIAFVFIGTGIFSTSLQSTKSINLSELQNFGYGEVDEILHKTNGEQLIVKIDKQSNSINSISECDNFNLLISTNGCSVDVGDVVRVPLNIEEIKNNGNQQGFDYAKHMMFKGIKYKSYAEADEIKIIKHNVSLKAIAISIRDNIICTIETTSLKKETQNFLITILLGDKEYVTDEIREIFADSGIAHILALSGLHTAVIALLISYLLIPLNFIQKQKIKYCLIIVVIWIFAFITGLSPSVMRASVMITFYYLALALERQNNSLNALCCAATLILIISPFALYDIGAQLSFVTVLAILIFADKVNPINRRNYKYTYQFVSSIYITIIATISSWALTAFYFHKISLLFLPLNIIVIPLLPLYLGIVILYLIFFTTGIDVGIFASIIDFSYGLLVDSAQYISSLQFSTIEVWISEWSVAIYYLSMIVLAMAIYRRSRYGYILFANILLITILSVMALPNSKPSDGFIIQNNWNGTYVRLYNNGKDSLITLQQDTTSFHLFHNKRIIFVDNNRISLMETRRDRLIASGDTLRQNFAALSCDYLLIGSGYRGKIEYLLRHYNPKLIVVMPEVYKEKQFALIEEAANISFTIHIISKNAPLRYLIE